jgi:hypothetical protein
MLCGIHCSFRSQLTGSLLVRMVVDTRLLGVNQQTLERQCHAMPCHAMPEPQLYNEHPWPFPIFHVGGSIYVKDPIPVWRIIWASNLLDNSQLGHTRSRTLRNKTISLARIDQTTYIGTDRVLYQGYIHGDRMDWQTRPTIQSQAFGACLVGHCP